MSLTTKNQLLIAFKKLVGKAHTNAQFGSANESVGSNVQLDNSTIFAQTIPASPNTALYSITNNIVEKVRFDVVSISLAQYTAVGAAGGGITADGDGAPTQGTFTNGIHAFALTLPSNYTTLSSNPKKGTGVYINGQSLTASNGALQIVPERYGASYPAQVSSSTGIIAALDEEDYLVDPYSGILFLQDINRVPTSVTAYIYIGDYLNQTVSGTTGQFTTVSASVISASQYVGLPSFSATPGGTDQTVQFNSGSTFSGSTNLRYNYTTNVLSGTVAQFTNITASFTGSGAGLFGIPNAGLVNSSVTVGSTNISLGGTATTIQGITVLTGSTVTGSTALFTQITGNLFGTASFATNAGNASTVTNGVYTNANNTFTGVNTFSNFYITGSITGSDAKFSTISGSHTGSGAGLFGIPNSGLVNSSITVGSTNISLGGAATTIQGITVITGSTVTGSVALFTQITGNLLGTASFATNAENASTVTNGVYTNANNTFTGINTFTNSYITGSITGSDAKFSTVTGSFTGSGVGLFNLTASGISNFTNDVRAQFSAGTNVTIINGVISSTGGGGGGTPGGSDTQVQFNSGSSFGGSADLTYNYNAGILSGTIARFTTVTGSVVTGSTALFTTITASNINVTGTLSSSSAQSIIRSDQGISFRTRDGGTGSFIERMFIATNDTINTYSSVIGTTISSSVMIANIITGSITVTGSTALFTTITGSTITGSNGLFNILSASVINVTNSSVVDVSSSVAALRITQRGTGESIRVEDSANPDATPFIIDGSGNIGIGKATPNAVLDIVGNTIISGNLNVTGSTTLTTISGTTAQFSVITSSFTGSGAGLFGIPNSGLVNSSITVGSTNISLGSTATTIQGITELTASNITGSDAKYTTITASFTGSGAGLFNLTASGINNFTNDVRSQFSAGTNITILNGVISSTGGGGGGSPGGTDQTVQFNSGSAFSGSTNLVYNYITNTLSGTIAQFSVITSSFTGSGVGLYDLTASGITNFTNDVRSQFSAGANITIAGGVISATTGSVIGSVITVTGNYVVLTTDDRIFTDGTLTLTLPSAVGSSGKSYYIKNIGTGSVTITGTLGQKIDGYDNMIITEQNSALGLLSNNIGWYIF